MKLTVLISFLLGTTAFAASPVLYVGTHVGLGTGITNSSGSTAAFLSANNVFTGTTNSFVGNLGLGNTYVSTMTATGNWASKTNQNQITPDFSIPEQLMTTNAAFTFLTPIGVDTTKTEAQWTLVNVTNTTAAAVAVTPPPNVHGVGTLFVTNWSLCYFQCYAQKITNMFVVPVF